MSTSQPDEPKVDASQLDAVQRSMLDQERFIASILKLRNTTPPAHWWESSGLVSGIVAVATLVVTSAANYITQSSGRERDFEYTEKSAALREQRASLAALSDLVATVLKSTEDRLDLARGKYDDLPQARREEITRATNLADRQWRHDRESQDVQLRLYYGSDTQAISHWTSARAALQQYCDCVEQTYRRYLRKLAPDTACQNEHSLAERRLQSLRTALVNVYQNGVHR